MARSKSGKRRRRTQIRHKQRRRGKRTKAYIAEVAKKSSESV